MLSTTTRPFCAFVGGARRPLLPNPAKPRPHAVHPAERGRVHCPVGKIHVCLLVRIETRWRTGAVWVEACSAVPWSRRTPHPASSARRLSSSSRTRARAPVRASVWPAGIARAEAGLLRYEGRSPNRRHRRRHCCCRRRRLREACLQLELRK